MNKEKNILSNVTKTLEGNVFQLAELFPASLFVLNEQGIIYDANETALELIGEGKNNIVQTNFIDFIEENYRDSFLDFLKNTYETSITQKTNLKIKGKDNKNIYTVVLAKIVKGFAIEEKLCSVALVDLTYQKMQEEIIKESSKRFENMANTAPVMIWIADVNGLFSFLNNVWLKFTGRKMGDDLGMNWVKNVFTDDLENLLLDYQKALSSRITFLSEFRFKREDGKFRWILMKGVPRFSSAGIFMGFIGSCADITEQKEIQVKVEKLNIELAELNTAKDKFFSIISHDLRSPLGGLKEILHMMATEYDSFEENEIKELIGEAATSAKNTYSLMENLLEWSFVQTGKIPYNPECLNLRTIINGLESIYTQNMKNKQINFKIEVEPEISVFADVKMTETILRNLISNAIKFTYPNGTISVSSEVDNDSVVIKVKDTGIGIEPEIISKLFRVGESHLALGTAKETGSGLGLILCKELVEKQKGRIWVESEKDKGTTFLFNLPAGN